MRFHATRMDHAAAHLTFNILTLVFVYVLLHRVGATIQRRVDAFFLVARCVGVILNFVYELTLTFRVGKKLVFCLSGWSSLHFSSLPFCCSSKAAISCTTRKFKATVMVAAERSVARVFPSDRFLHPVRAETSLSRATNSLVV
jgi:hypothetical protein